MKLKSTLEATHTFEQVFVRDVHNGLSQTNKHIPCKYFYDEHGSRLFDQICELDEYYPTQTELSIMDNHATAIAKMIGSNTMLVEYGSGSSVKTTMLLDCLDRPAAYVPVDISKEHLLKTAQGLSDAYPSIEILPVSADFTHLFQLPEPTTAPDHVTIYFPGSTIGNFEPPEAERILSDIASMCQIGGQLLIGIDLKKDSSTLEAAYNDAAGVTAQFNINVLRRINRELDSDFALEQFLHIAEYDDRAGRITMYLESTADQVVTVAGKRFEFTAGERICTEFSHKYSVEDFSTLAARADLQHVQTWTDARDYFAVMMFEVAPG